jgi:hypothetical protein
LTLSEILPFQFKLHERSPYNPKVVANASDSLNLGLESLIIGCQNIQLENYEVKSYTFGSILAIQHKAGQYATFEIEV